MFNIMEFDLPRDQGRYEQNRGSNFMVLESINSMPAKVVHVFDLTYDTFNVGRSVETDMKIAVLNAEIAEREAARQADRDARDKQLQYAMHSEKIEAMNRSKKVVRDGSGRVAGVE